MVGYVNDFVAILNLRTPTISITEEKLTREKLKVNSSSHDLVLPRVHFNSFPLNFRQIRDVL